MLTIYTEAIPKPRMTKRDKWKKRPIVVKFRHFCDILDAEARKNDFILGDKFSVEFYFTPPKSTSQKKKRELVGQPHKRKPDIDNLLKGVMDALNKSDQSVYSVYAEKYWSDVDCIVIRNT